MKAVMMSIQPKWCELIASGKKTIEVRKTRPKLETPFKVYIYCTKGKEILAVSRYSDKSVFLWDKSDVDNYNSDMIRNGKVIGEFVCDTYIVDKTFGYDPLMYAAACMSESDVAWYCTNKKMYGWHIFDVVIYDEPKELSEFFVYCDRCDKRPIACEFAYEESNENGYYSECKCDFKRPIKRPPQSWCYVEGLR